jgi:hypothetical protein
MCLRGSVRAVRRLVEADGAVEQPAGLDRAVEHVGQQLLDVGPGRGRAAGPGEVAHDHVEADRPSVYWGTPTRLTTPPSRTMPNAVSSACLVPTHSSTVWVPSPSTVTDVRGPTPAFTAQWWPVQNTSDRVSSEGSIADGQLHQRALGLRHPHRLALAAVHAVEAVAATVSAGGVQTLGAEVAGVVRPHER